MPTPINKITIKGRKNSVGTAVATDAPAADVESRLSILCRWALQAEQRGQQYGLRLPGTAIPPGRGEAHRTRCLEALALFGIEGPR
jgi:uncharacterized protein (DUF58 family)